MLAFRPQRCINSVSMFVCIFISIAVLLPFYGISMVYRVTSPRHLGIRGGSNGGLLVCNVMLLRPDLFGAVTSAVPLADMKRYTKLLAGASWMEEYGNPDVKEVSVVIVAMRYELL